MMNVMDAYRDIFLKVIFSKVTFICASNYVSVCQCTISLILPFTLTAPQSYGQFVLSSVDIVNKKDSSKFFKTLDYSPGLIWSFYPTSFTCYPVKFNVIVEQISWQLKYHFCRFKETI